MGGFHTGGLPDLDLSFLFFVLSCPFWDFPDFGGIFLFCPGIVGISRLVLFSLSRPMNSNFTEGIIIA